MDTTAELEITLMRLNSYLEKYMEAHKEFENRDIVLDFYFDSLRYMATVERLDECYEIYGRIADNGEFYVHLMCINPSGNLKFCMEKAVSTIFFSATLLPVNYYKELLSGNKDDYAMYVDSPFKQENRLIFAAKDVTSKYTRRNRNEYERIADYIHKVLSSKVGNYMVFFPSYSLLKSVYEVIVEREDFKDIVIVCQQSNMSERDREDFLAQFETVGDNSLGAFCVMGGIFSEGIDLTNDKLIGTVVVGTGLPQVCVERDIIMNYFKDKGMNGFDYAYKYPGMNKVQQAAGRVIRTHEDTGIIALLDERFATREYGVLFPREWNDISFVNINEAGVKIDEFVERTYKR
jgi:Rad3-related DNA helicase